MLARTLPVVVLLCACTSTAPLPGAEQPQLAQLAQPYAAQLQAVGITRIVSPGSGALVRLETGYGSVYVAYPPRLPPMAFVLDVAPEGLRARAATFNPALDARLLAELVPEAVRVTQANNQLGWMRANPWN